MKCLRHFNKISTKITLGICIILIVSLFFSNIISYVYFSKKMLNQEFERENEKLTMLTNQVNYLINDLVSFSLSIAMENDVQNYLLGEESIENELENRLDMLGVQRDYIFNIVLKNESEGILLSKSTQTSGISQSLYRELLGNTLECDLGPSELYTFLPDISGISQLNNQNRILTFIMKVNHLKKYNVPLGQIIINIDYDKFLNIILKNLDSVDFENLYWLTREGSLLYASDDISESLLSTFRKVVTPSNSPGTVINGSYIVCTQEPASQWKFISATPVDSLRDRISYIVYFFLIIAAFISLGSAIWIRHMIRRFLRPLSEIEHNMNNFQNDYFDYKPLHIYTADEFETLAEGYNNMMERIQNYIANSVKYEQEKKNLEMSLLVAQINPHFIYNTLNTIIYLSYNKDTDKIIDVTRSFITLLQDSVRINEDGFFSTVREEICIVKSYLDIQQNRYKNKFDVSFFISEDCLNQKIMRSMLQPIVENSLLHGIFPKSSVGHIDITITLEDNFLICAIEDNGVGISKDKIHDILSGNRSFKHDGVYSIGLNNILERLQLLYGNNYEFHIESQPGSYCRISIHMPV